VRRDGGDADRRALRPRVAGELAAHELGVGLAGAGIVPAGVGGAVQADEAPLPLATQSWIAFQLSAEIGRAPVV
jgi:hypothetical protein